MRVPSQAPPLARSGRGQRVRRFAIRAASDGVRLSQYNGEEEQAEGEEYGDSSEGEGGDDGEAAVESE